MLVLALGLGLKEITIKPNRKEGYAGLTTCEDNERGDTLESFAPDAHWFRKAVHHYAGAEAERRLGVRDHTAGADGDWASDYDKAAVAINNITDDPASMDHLHKLARRRCEILVAYYWPEIEVVARRLLRSITISGKTARKLWADSTTKRKALHLSW